MSKPRGSIAAGILAVVLTCNWTGALPFVSTAAWAQEPPRADSGIPEKPSAPPTFRFDVPTDPFQCQRYFTYKGKKINCDSNLRFDGEKLRPIIEKVPEAVAELNQYQKNRLKIRNAAYVGTAGLAIILFGSVVSSLIRSKTTTPSAAPSDADKGTHDLADAIATGSIVTGSAVTAGSLVYGLSFIQANESHLHRAVDHFNRAHPDSPIELKFTTLIYF